MDSITVTTTDWLEACRGAVGEMRVMLEATVGIEARATETGTRGSGGDHTLVLDESAEAIVFSRLDELHRRGHRFTAISEERGEVDYGSTDTRVVIDPIDGSLNAKRGLAHHALSFAVARGQTMADVVFGFVHDFGTGEEWWAELGQGAFLDGTRLDPTVAERRGRDGRIEILGIESADPRLIRMAIDDLAEHAYRLRALGAIAVSLCQVAAGRFDALVSLQGCRSVDAAAAQLIVREAGGVVTFPRLEAPLSAPLDLLPHSPIVAARNPASLPALEGICRPR